MKKLFSSFYFAISGIVQCCRTEKNFQLQACIAITVIFGGWVFNIASIDWVALLLCCAMVLCLEMVNAAIEKLADVVHLSFHPGIKNVKDIAAGAVLIASVISIIIALIIFIPKMFFK